MHNDFTETEIIEASQRGDLDAFNILIQHHQDFLFRVALRFMQSEDLASDAVQDACLLAFRKIATYHGGVFKNWFARIVVNVCYDDLRRQNRYPVQLLEPISETDNEQSSPYWLVDYSTNPEIQCESREFEHTVQACLENISPHYRAVLVLIDIEELSYDDASDILQIPIGTIKSRLSRARLQMRSALQAFDDLLPTRYQTRNPMLL